MPDTIKPSRVVRIRKSAGRGMSEGLVWVEAYLPFDAQAFSDFSGLVVKHGSAVAAQAANPELAARALTPIDTHGEAMLQADVLKLAHRFMVQSRKVDVMHDEQGRDTVQVVQSFVNTPEIASPNFYPGAWVAVLKVEQGSAEWASLEAGELDAVSFQAYVGKVPIAAAAPAQE